MNGTESRGKLLDRIARQRRTIEALREQLRVHACVTVTRPAYGGGTVASFRRCMLCGSEWGSDAPETHVLVCQLSGVAQT
jgi:hypothetical protein